MRAKNESKAGKFAASLFFLLFGIAGLVAGYFISLEVYGDMQTYRWEQSQCLIEAASLRDKGGAKDPFELKVRYSYSYFSQKFTSSQLQKRQENFDSFSDASELLHNFKPGDTVDCYVNPDDRSEAVLIRGNWAFALFLLIPVVFVCVGFGGIYGLFFFKEEKSRLKKARNNKGQAIVKFIAFALFAAGLATLWPLLVSPFLMITESASWQELDCKVKRSWIERFEGDSDSGPTYRANVLYSYEYQGQSFMSDRKNFFPRSSGSHSGAKKELRQYQRGKSFRCFVNPEKPFQAVISREYELGALLGLIPLVLLILGFFLFRHSRGEGDSSPSAALESAGLGEALSNEIILKPKHSPLFKAFSALAFGSIWTGFSVFMFLQVDDSFGQIFLGIFVLVGLLIFLSSIYFLLADSNLRPRLVIPSPVLHLGGAYRLQWYLDRPKRAVLFPVREPQSLQLKLEATEEATYQRGTDTVTAKNIFFSKTVVELRSIPGRSGEAGIEFPIDGMHSFSANRNKIVWRLTLKGEIAKWPDISEEFEIEVKPIAEAGNS